MASQKEFKPTIVGFLCNWCCYGGADLCGVSRFQYPPYLRVIRVMCSGRVDLKFILRSFANGADGVFIGGCHLNDCHYNPEGNYDALVLSKIARKLLEAIGINPERLRLEWVSAGEGIRFAEIMNGFSQTIKRLGPLGESEEMEPADMAFHLEAARRLVPFIKLWEREQLRIPERTEEACNRFLATGQMEQLFDDIILEKLAVSRITLLLREQPLSTRDISRRLGLNPSDVSRHMLTSSRHGLIRYDTAINCYTLAGTGN